MSEIDSSIMPSLHPITTNTSSGSRSLTLFELGIDDNRKIFMPGQRVEGQLSMNLAVPALIQLLRIRFTGYISTHLYKPDSNMLDNASTATLFKDLQTCIGTSDILEKPVQIPAGDYVYPFSFRLPALSLPPSYDGIYGTVRYEIGAVLIWPGHANKSTTLSLTIPSTLDSNADMYDESVEASLRKSVGMWLWNCGHVDVKASIPRQAYTSEESIPLSIDITNQSTATLHLASIVMKQKTACKTPDNTRSLRTERIHALQFSETYLPLLKEIHRTVHFPVPDSTIISPSIRTAILEVSHYLVVKLVARGSRPRVPSNEGTCGRKRTFPWLRGRWRDAGSTSTLDNIVEETSNSGTRSSADDSSTHHSSLTQRGKSLDTPDHDSSSSTNEAPSAISQVPLRSTSSSSSSYLPHQVTDDLLIPRPHRHSLATSMSSGRSTGTLPQLGHYLTTPISYPDAMIPAAATPAVTSNLGKKSIGSFFSDCVIKVQVPFVIGGFPNMIYDGGLRRSIDTLPMYDGGGGSRGVGADVLLL